MKFKGQQRTTKQTVHVCFQVPAQEQEESPSYFGWLDLGF